MSERTWWGARPGVWLVRVALLLGVLLSVLAGAPAGYGPPVVLVVVVFLAALAAGFYPEGLALPIAMALVVVWWTAELRDGLPVAILLAAAGLVVAHVGATLLAYGPPSMPVEPRLAALWAARGVLVWLASVAVWGVARAYSGHGTPTLYWLLGLCAAVVGSVAVGWALPPRLGGADPDGAP